MRTSHYVIQLRGDAKDAIPQHDCLVFHSLTGALKYIKENFDGVNYGKFDPWHDAIWVWEVDDSLAKTLRWHCSGSDFHYCKEIMNFPQGVIPGDAHPLIDMLSES